MNPYRYWTIAHRKKGADWEILDKSMSGINADPFLAVENGRHFLFYEKADPITFKGYLVCMDLDADRKKARTILKEPFHLSYPNVFKVGDFWYLIPESKQNHKVTLYRAVDFPWKWERVRDLLEEDAVDTTFVFRDGSWYFYTYIDGALRLYRSGADELGLPKSLVEIRRWEASKRMRPGGKFYEENGVLYRPAQICEQFYGEALVFCRQKWDISQSIFEEEEKRELRAGEIDVFGRSAIGIHTYNKLEDYEVVDIYCEQYGVWAFLKKLLYIPLQLLYEKLRGKD